MIDNNLIVVVGYDKQGNKRRLKEVKHFKNHYRDIKTDEIFIEKIDKNNNSILLKPSEIVFN